MLFCTRAQFTLNGQSQERNIPVIGKGLRILKIRSSTTSMFRYIGLVSKFDSITRIARDRSSGIVALSRMDKLSKFISSLAPAGSVTLAVVVDGAGAENAGNCLTISGSSTRLDSTLRFREEDQKVLEVSTVAAKLTSDSNIRDQVSYKPSASKLE